MKDSRIYLKHIADCAAFVELLANEGKDNFFSDRKTRDAILRNLQILAESTQRLPEVLKDACPEIPWQSIRGLRNILTHDYLGLRLDRIWEIITSDIPSLSAAIRRTLSEEDRLV